MKMIERNYSPIYCIACGEKFKPYHPCMKRCRSCMDIKCASCGKKLDSSFARHKKYPNAMCDKCRKVAIPYGTTRAGWGGYVEIKTKNGWMLEHRYVMGLKIGRPLRRSEIVHHIDGNPSNNKIENLVLCKSLRDHLDKYHKNDLVDPPTHHFGRKKWAEREHRLFRKK